MRGCDKKILVILLLLVSTAASGQSIYYKGSWIAEIEPDGDVYIHGSWVGEIEEDGDVYYRGSFIGEGEGIKKEWLAGFFFFFFWDLETGSPKEY